MKPRGHELCPPERVCVGFGHPCEQLEAEVERLTLADRQWADHFKRLAEESERLRVQVEETAKECSIQKTENERLRAAIETAAAMVSKADPVLANALLRRLGRRPASNV